MQCKDIPDVPILAFLDSLNGTWATWYSGYPNSVTNVMPPGIPRKLVLAKMRQLIRRGLVGGCNCGCRGDFTLTYRGRAYLAQNSA